MERRGNREEYHPWGFSSRNLRTPSPSFSSPQPNHRCQNLYSEYHPVRNTAPNTQNLLNFHTRMPENRPETFSPMPGYHPDINIYNRDIWEYENQGGNFLLPQDIPSYQYHHQNFNSCFPEIPENVSSLEAAMNALTITNSLYTSPLPLSEGPGFRHSLPHQTAMDLQRMRIKSAVNGQWYTAAPYNIQPRINPHQYQNLLRNQNPTPHRGLTNNFGPNHDIHHRHRPPRNNGVSRSHSQNYSSLEEIRGRIAEMATEKEGCSFLQSKLDTASREEFMVIFSEILECVCDVMTDQFGHHLIQKLYKKCNEEDITMIVLAVSNEDRLLSICLDMHGTHAIQGLLEHYIKTRDQISIILSVFWPITIVLSQNVNGHHVIIKCLSKFSFEDTKHIANEVAHESVELAMDKSGCCVLQACVRKAQGEVREQAIADISANAVILSQHCFGNYVVQLLLEMKEPRVSGRVIAQLKGRFVSLSMNKYGSNVVEACFKECPQDQYDEVIRELISSPNFLAVLQDQYGNYVAQTALEYSKKNQGRIYNILAGIVQSHKQSLKSHPYGKLVLGMATGEHKPRRH